MAAPLLDSLLLAANSALRTNYLVELKMVISETLHEYFILENTAKSTSLKVHFRREMQGLAGPYFFCLDMSASIANFD